MNIHALVAHFGTHDDLPVIGPMRDLRKLKVNFAIYFADRKEMGNDMGHVSPIIGQLQSIILKLSPQMQVIRTGQYPHHVTVMLRLNA